MTSSRKIAANRVNGGKSRGPRTAAGKKTASRNAMRHGLSTINRSNPLVAADIARLADAKSMPAGPMSRRACVLVVAHHGSALTSAISATGVASQTRMSLGSCPINSSRASDPPAEVPMRMTLRPDRDIGRLAFGAK